MEAIERDLPSGTLAGECAPQFHAIAEEFERNFRERNEVGASVCVRVDGETVVDLWGGVASQEDQTPWARDTISIVFSCTKAATALCAHMLASRGQLDVDAPVAKYWPEFAAAGKQRATVKMMLDHSVGVPAIREKVKPGGVADWDYMCDLLAGQEPFWKPGIRNGYHMLSFGWTVGEIVRRVSGKSLGTFFREEVAEPLGIEFWIGMPEEHEARVAPMIPFAPTDASEIGEFAMAMMSEPEGIPALSLLNLGGFDPNLREYHAAEIGGGGGISNARGLAGMYAPLACGGRLGEVELVSADVLARMGETSTSTHEDATLLIPTRFALGFMKSMDNRSRAHGDRDSALLGASAFGHAGAGGSMGFADPEARMSFGYSMNRMGNGIMINERGQSLVDAAYRALGYRSNASGAWRR